MSAFRTSHLSETRRLVVCQYGWCAFTSLVFRRGLLTLMKPTKM